MGNCIGKDNRHRQSQQLNQNFNAQPQQQQQMQLQSQPQPQAQMTAAQTAFIYQSLYQTHASNGRQLSQQPARPVPQQPMQPPPQEPLIKTAVGMKCYSSINKNSIKLIPKPNEPNTYSIEFEIVTTYESHMTIYFFAQEMVDIKGIPYFYVDTSKYPPPQFYKIPVGNQNFQNLCFINTAQYKIDELFFKNKQIYPIIVEILPIYDLNLMPPQSQATYFIFSRTQENLSLKPIRQKFTVSGVSYELMEIFGSSKENDEDSRECIICMAETKNTAVMPCAHVCLCEACALLIQKEAKPKCPICRGKIKGYMKIEAAAEKNDGK
ncbi:unnamed protein product [Blepharisma stoltei]|uniref:RING-type domain-containing protein n=1 Tax=Blepharisma stoltei TaxID=1481888 RepID=A0AAU9J548_9CILI|nr:unnamed protein product [Blepharisma stoltei]